MSRRWRTCIFCSACVAFLTCATTIILISRASTKPPGPASHAVAQSRQPSSRLRNLSLKPEAFSVSRRLGDRFKPMSRAVTTALGNVTVGGNQQPLVLVRRQTENGETVEIQIGNRVLNWNGMEGLSALSGALSAAERLMAERLILDSPDQFVLAQLRGASYFTLARNVRPSDALDGYNGPLWNLVRVDEPRQQNENLRALSTWRIYYINVHTGLPDRIEYQLNGQDIRVDFVQWTEQNGQKTPFMVRWSSGAQLLMEYQSTSVSHNQE